MFPALKFVFNFCILAVSFTGLAEACQTTHTPTATHHPTDPEDLCDHPLASVLCNILGLEKDPIIYMNSPEIIKYYGYPVENHTITTDDGYIIDLFRIPYGKNGSATSIGQPVLVQHGLYASSDFWLLNPPDSILPFVLYNAGYDVWIANVRGNTYGLKHVSLNSNNEAFWKFSCDEISKYDLPKMIDTIRDETGYDKIIHIGYSMGNTMMFILLSIDPSYNDKVKLHIAMGPAVYSTGFPAGIQVLSKLGPLVFTPLGAITHDTFNPNSGVVKSLLQTLCGIFIVDKACSNLMLSISGYDKEQYIENRTEIYISFFPSSTSVRTLQQFTQAPGLDGNLCMYSYGPIRNFIVYGKTTPPVYNISKVSCPTALFWGANDQMATPNNTALLKSVIQSHVVLDYRVPYDKWTHLDFQFGKDLNPLVHEPMLALMSNYTSTKKSSE